MTYIHTETRRHHGLRTSGSSSPKSSTCRELHSFTAPTVENGDRFLKYMACMLCKGKCAVQGHWDTLKSSSEELLLRPMPPPPPPPALALQGGDWLFRRAFGMPPCM